MNGHSQQVFEEVVKRLAQLLRSQVALLNSQKTVIASNYPDSFGIPFEQIQPIFGHTYVSVPVYCHGEVNELIVSESTQGEVLPGLVQGLIELVINQAASETQLLNQRELKDKFIYDLLRGFNLSETDILRDAQILGMDLTRRRAVVLIDAKDYILRLSDQASFKPTHTQIWQRSQFVISSVVSFFHLPSDTICAYIGDGEVAVLKASSTQDLVAWTNQDDEPNQFNSSWANLSALKRAATALLSRLQYETQTAISVGIGRYHPTLRGLSQSYQDAQVALSLGKRFNGQNQIHCLDRLGIAAFVGVSDEDTKIDLARYLLSPLNQEFELLETLDIFFRENCCASTTAKRLAIHRNTLSYRLDKIAVLTGLDSRRFDDAVQIRLALILRSLRQDIIRKTPHPLPFNRGDAKYIAEELEEPSTFAAKVVHS